MLRGTSPRNIRAQEGNDEWDELQQSDNMTNSLLHSELRDSLAETHNAVGRELMPSEESQSSPSLQKGMRINLPCTAATMMYSGR
jgi:hypothetical protein